MMKMNKNGLLFAGLLMILGSINAMERSILPFEMLPRELQKEVVVIMLNNQINNLPKKPESMITAAEKIRDLATVNKFFNQVLNESKFCLQLIKNFSRHFDVSNTQAAKSLNRVCAQNRLNLQNQLKDCLYAKKISTDLLKKLLNDGADLEWTYDSGALLWMAVQDYKDNALKVLAEYGANVNMPTGKMFPTILDYVVMNFGKDVIKIFIVAGADVTKLDPSNRENEKLQQVLAEMGKK